MKRKFDMPTISLLMRASLFASLLIAVACAGESKDRTVQDTPTPTVAPSTRARVAFLNYQKEGPQLLVAKDDGSLPFQVTQAPIFELNPFDWSPDGTRLAFASANGADVLVLNLNGLRLQQLTTSPSGDNSPRWSPDGRRIAFRSARSGNYEVWVMNADGSDQTQLSRTSALVSALAWSPDGNFIAFTLVSGDLYIMGADGSDAKQLTRYKVVDSAPLAWSPDSRTVLFSANTGAGQTNIFSVDLNGGEPRQITADVDGGGSSPVWSPDGTSIAFTAGPRRDIFTMRSNGSDRRRLTSDPADDAHPSWSADGQWIVFDTDRRAGNREIYVMRSDGSGQRRFTAGPWSNTEKPVWSPGSVPTGDLYPTPQPEVATSPPTAEAARRVETAVTRLTDNILRDSDPTWSPDGKRIAFLSGSAPDYFIWTMNADGSDARSLSSQRVDGDLAWSPDGSRFAFSVFANGNFDIWVTNADGSGVTRLTDKPHGEYHPAWSPDGNLIAFVSGGNICTMKPDGTMQSCLTEGRTDDGPSWSPDGKRIAFSSNRYGSDDIYVMNSDGTGQTRLMSPGTDSNPEWSPDGKHISFVSERDGGSDLYVMEPDGSKQARLTDGLHVQRFAWSPQGSRIAFAAYTRATGSIEIYILDLKE
jgi:Tol biopolymer transport system component